jgi:hypothetical protein
MTSRNNEPYKSEENNPGSQHDTGPDEAFCVTDSLGILLESVEDLLLRLESGFSSSRGKIVSLSLGVSKDGAG